MAFFYRIPECANKWVSAPVSFFFGGGLILFCLFYPILFFFIVSYWIILHYSIVPKLPVCFLMRDITGVV